MVKTTYWDFKNTLKARRKEAAVPCWHRQPLKRSEFTLLTSDAGLASPRASLSHQLPLAATSRARRVRPSKEHGLFTLSFFTTFFPFHTLHAIPNILDDFEVLFLPWISGEIVLKEENKDTLGKCYKIQNGNRGFYLFAFSCHFAPSLMNLFILFYKRGISVYCIPFTL